ncbi:phage tail tube protein [Amorphus sp. 3PC139-8]|uniref:phage tail tube protein n=1 Tax=Amorphus sp. 3PC139-8 TaxID=2735676 RepID=UPI00345D6906
MSNLLSGTLYIKVDGTQYLAKGSFTVNVTPTQREGVAGLDGTHGFKETPKVPYIEGTFTTQPGFSIDTLHDHDDVTVTVELANNTAYMLRSAWFAGDGEINADDAEITGRFEGMSGEQIK